MVNRLVSLLVALPALVHGGVSDFVNPMIGTCGGNGLGGWGDAALSPAAIMPFPAMRLAPDTTRFDPVLASLFGNEWLDVWSKLNRHGGYFGSDNAVAAFSHVHLQGAGEADLGNVGVMVTRNFSAAQVAQEPVSLGPLYVGRNPWAAPFSQASVVASPGYFGLSLPAPAFADVALAAASTHAGIQRYSCWPTDPAPDGSPGALLPCTLVVDACHTTHDGDCPWASVAIAPAAPVTVAGSPAALPAWTVDVAVNNTGEFSVSSVTGKIGVMIYVHALLTAAYVGAGGAASPATLTTAGLWEGFALRPPSQTANATSSSGSLGSFFTFEAPSPLPAPAPAVPALTLELRVGVSFVSAAAAKVNLAASQQLANGTWISLEAVHAGARAAWDELLGAVQVTPASTTAAAAAEELRELGLGAQATAQPPSPRAAEVAAAAAVAAEEGATAGRAALEAYLRTPDGAVHALEAGWMTLEQAAPLLAPRERAAALGICAVDTDEGVDAAVRSAAEAALGHFSKAKASRGISDVADPASDLTVFYTALFHSYSAPTTYSEPVDGAYLGFDYQVHTAPADQRFLSDLSIWDIFRTQMPFLSVALPAAAADIASSLLLMFQQGGVLPRWPFANVETGTMVGSHAICLMLTCLQTGACQDGQRGFSLATAYNATLASMTAQESRGGYASLGFEPFPTGSGSWTLEYAFDDACASGIAQAAGDATGAATFWNRSHNAMNAWYSSVNTIAPRFANGSFWAPSDLQNSHPFNPLFTEGNARQWQWFAPVHTDEAVAAAGGPGAYAAALQALLANQTTWPLGTFLPNAWFWAGNEPDMMAPWQFAFADAAFVDGQASANYTSSSWRAAFWSRWLLREYYGLSLNNAGQAIPGNDDYAALSSSVVWAYLGVYPIAGTPFFVIGSPVWANATISIPQGWDTASRPAGAIFTVTTYGGGGAAIYPSAVSLNGKPLASALVQQADLFPPGGSTLLEVWMSETPGLWPTLPTS